MKAFIVSLLVVLSATFTYAEEDPSLSSSTEETPVYGPTLPDDSRDNSWSEERENRLRLECRQRRITEESFRGDGLLDRAIGNRVRRNLEENRRDANDGFENIRRADGSVESVRVDPCARYNPPEPKVETDSRGCKVRITGSQRRIIAGTCRW